MFLQVTGKTYNLHWLKEVSDQEVKNLVVAFASSGTTLFSIANLEAVT
jgi:hypothetical protein